MRNVGESAFDKLRNLARRRGGGRALGPSDMPNVLQEYATECVLRRVSASELRPSVLLKGGRLWTAYGLEAMRPTVDLDLSAARGARGAEEAFARRLLDALGADAGDGMRFDAAAARWAPMREGIALGGVKVQVPAALHSARIPVQVEVGFGHVVPGGGREVVWRPMLEGVGEPFRLLAYPFEMMAAEKLRAAVEHGLSNTRLKDFYDLMRLAAMDPPLDSGLLRDCLRATAEQNRVRLPETAGEALGLSDEFAARNEQVWRGRRWREWTGRPFDPAADPPLASVVADLRRWADDLELFAPEPSPAPGP